MRQNPDFDDKKWLLNHTADAVKIMTASCNIGGINYPIWYPSLGVVKYRAVNYA